MFSSKPRLIFVNRIDKSNVGDLSCMVMKSLASSTLDILSEEFRISSLDVNRYQKILPDDVLVVGGGGLLNLTFQKFWDHARNNRYVALGIGQNFGSDKTNGVAKNASPEELHLYHEVISRAKFVALRDHTPDLPYCVCPSIFYVEAFLNRVRDCNLQDAKPLVVKHHQVRLPDQLLESSVDIVPNSRGSVYDLLAKIWNSSEVFTSSYHAFLWSTLLGKKVTVLPFSSKFHASPYLDKAVVAESLSDFGARLARASETHREVVNLLELRQNATQAREAYQNVLNQSLRLLK